jgi:hypothetical protein
LAWYFGQVWPSDIGVAKPFYFLFMPSYWFPIPTTASTEEVVSGIQLAEDTWRKEGGNLEKGNPQKVPEEIVNEKLTGAPSVVLDHLKKTFGTQVAVNNLSFKMYENQIFALLGHNGAGKVSTRVNIHFFPFLKIILFLADHYYQHAYRLNCSRLL